jgi:hypothetical protein
MSSQGLDPNSALNISELFSFIDNYWVATDFQRFLENSIDSREILGDFETQLQFIQAKNQKGNPDRRERKPLF